MIIVTTSPFYSNLKLKTGSDPKSESFSLTLKALPDETDEIFIPNRGHPQVKNKYESIKKDDYDLRLIVFSPTVKKGSPKVEFHIFGNGISIFTVEFKVKQKIDSHQLEKYCQDVTRKAFNMHCCALQKLLDNIRQSLSSELVDRQIEKSSMNQDSLCWISRAVILGGAEIESPDGKVFTRKWLENTAQPADADALVSRDIYFSISWLNYLVVDPSPEQRRSLFSALRIAQYFYASQERLNEIAYQALTNSALEKNVRTVEKRLINSRRDMQMLNIIYDTQRFFMTRKKRELLDELMTVWDFDVLKSNGERMIHASDTKILEITNKRSERSSFFTDLILVALALVTVVEVSIYMTEYSREVMSRPSLAYQDDETSWILKLIATVDTDKMLVGGAFVILVLVCFYVYWKIKR